MYQFLYACGYGRVIYFGFTTLTAEKKDLPTEFLYSLYEGIHGTSQHNDFPARPSLAFTHNVRDRTASCHLIILRHFTKC